METADPTLPGRPGVVERTDPLVGRTLGEFTVRERIGEGGFGAVYRADQPRLAREAVIKTLHRHLSRSPDVVARFEREAKLASRLEHPYAAHVYAYGAEPDGLLWIAMERVRGATVTEILERTGTMPLDQLVGLFERICEVVHTAHEQGIIHRDIKPSNVMVLARAGRLLPKLLDFGIAKALGGTVGEPVPPRPHRAIDPLDATLADDTDPDPDPEHEHELDPEHDPEHSSTRAGVVIGSPAYMAPELFDGAEHATPQADLYALGVFAYRTLTGRHPFEEQTLAALEDAHRSHPVPPVGAGLPAALDAVLGRAMAKRAADRHATALELAAALRRAAGMEEPDAKLPRLPVTLRDAVVA
ncbi:MAG TPA: serine/threonine-protein kinase, partial [Kofleriaceae bacterium]|nr:serine/threonine-protein kinase [Kofleriaceae bacterium]